MPGRVQIAVLGHHSYFRQDSQMLLSNSYYIVHGQSPLCALTRLLIASSTQTELILQKLKKIDDKNKICCTPCKPVLQCCQVLPKIRNSDLSLFTCMKSYIKVKRIFWLA